jgi:hypothetical protein
MRAPADVAVICVLILEDSPNSLAMKHLLDVGSRFGNRQQTPVAFRLGPYFLSYPPHYRVAFASSSLSKPPLHGPALRLACHALRMADRRLFHVPRN